MESDLLGGNVMYDQFNDHILCIGEVIFFIGQISFQNNIPKNSTSQASIETSKKYVFDKSIHIWCFNYDTVAFIICVPHHFWSVYADITNSP